MVSHNLIRSSDEVLLRQVALGDRIAYGELYEKYWHVAYSHAYKRLKDEELAKDIVQDIFVNIWLRKEKPIENFPAYLHIAVRNQVLKMVAKEKGRGAFLDFLPDLPSLHSQTDADIKWREFYQSYREIVNALPPKRHQIFSLRYDEDLTTKVIASRLGLSIKTVQNQLGKAVEQMRTSLLRLLMLLAIMVSV